MLPSKQNLTISTKSATREKRPLRPNLNSAKTILWRNLRRSRKRRRRNVRKYAGRRSKRWRTLKGKGLEWSLRWELKYRKSPPPANHPSQSSRRLTRKSKSLKRCSRRPTLKSTGCRWSSRTNTPWKLKCSTTDKSLLRKTNCRQSYLKSWLIWVSMVLKWAL